MTPTKHTRERNRIPPWPIVACLAVTGMLVFMLLRVVDLKPQVAETFFFSKGDPQVRVDNEIARTFPESRQIILAASGDIRSPAYADRVRALSDALARLPGVSSVQSLSRGPNGIDDAIKSPLWSRLLISADQRSTHLYVTIGNSDAAPLVGKIEALQQRFESPGFHVMISGFPYVTELIARNLARDLRTFSIAAVATFSIVLLIMFRSAWVLLGTFAACTTSSASTLIITHLAHIPIGPLTANLSTMVFVMTLSPVVFLTYNRRQVGEDARLDGREAVRETVRRTVVPSFWSGVCMLLGFISLLFVPSTPMRHLGVAGAVGATMAFIAAYTMYPWFLERARVEAGAGFAMQRIATPLAKFFAARHGGIVAGLAAFTVIGAIGLLRLNTDPSLPSYFKPHGDIRTGLEFVDEHGGSSPLKLVVAEANHAPMNHHEQYRQLWALQAALEQDPAVGSVISIAIVLGEAKRPFLAGFLSTERELKILDEPKYGEVTRELITRDRERALFIVRMRETARHVPRSEVIARLKTIVARNGFRTVEIGGTYNLLDQMAHLLTSSIISGVLLLLGVFGVMGLALSRSFRSAAAMVASLAIIPVVVRGFIAYVGMPLDFITASAANIDLGMGVDAMIYLTVAARRLEAGGLSRASAWSAACSRLWQPIGTSLLVICSGFGIFELSNFPPTQRFGLFVILGCATAAAAALFVFPWLATNPEPPGSGRPR